MLTAAGNINQPYEVIGMVHTLVTRTVAGAGCGNAGALPVQEAYEAANKGLRDAAAASGGDGVIHVAYDYRMSSRSAGCSQNAQPVFEVYGWGTAIRLK